MLTAEQAKAAMNAALETGNLGDFLQVAKSIIVDLVAEHNTTRRGAVALAREVKGIRDFFKNLASQAQSAPQDEGAPEAEVAPAPQPGGVRVGADGEPLSAEQTAVEDEMDAAIAAGGGAQAPAAPAKNGNGKHRPATPPQQRIGADGEPITDPAQLAAEAEMDAAMGK